jgi:hypothetical protein
MAASTQFYLSDLPYIHTVWIATNFKVGFFYRFLSYGAVMDSKTLKG